VIRLKWSLTVSRSLSHLLALAACFLGDRGRFLLVILIRRSHLALSAAALLGSRRRGGTDLAASVFNLLENVVRHGLHAADGSALEVGGGLVPVDL
jgi:hypothetical protein